MRGFISYRRLVRHLDRYFWAYLLVMGFVFYARFTYSKLAPDDVMWYQGRAATVFDQYRVLPLECFRLLNVLFGRSIIAAQGMIFLFHTLNAILVYHLGQRLLSSVIAGRVAAVIFFINPVTLGALTWISCFSYIIGASFALVALLAFARTISPGTTRPNVWSALAVGSYTVGLFCTHEIFLLPAGFVLLGWLHDPRAARRGWALLALSMAAAIPVYLFFYHFDRYGIESSNMLSAGFIAALASSGLSLGASLLTAYPLSFGIKTYDFLKASFDESTRWLLTGAILIALAARYRASRRGRLPVVLALLFGALIAPYISRLYLMSGAINYHPSYMLGGRVFYVPFIAVALLGGYLVREFGGGVARDLVRDPGFRLGVLVSAGGLYLHALFVLYDRVDFMGLAVTKNPLPFAPPPWNPYANDHILWLVGAALAAALLLAASLVLHFERTFDTQEQPPARSPTTPDASTRAISCGRRAFLPLLLREMLDTVSSARGKPGYAVADLDSLPDEQLATLRPVINPVYQIRVVDGHVCSQLKDQDDAPLRSHFRNTPENLAVFNGMNGQQTLREIAKSAAADLAWEEERAFQHARALFLDLASYLVAEPHDAQEPAAGTGKRLPPA
jgi:hypothetical protein